ncbi:MAG: CsbD family protein [Nitrospirales bacterium]|nr:CsbD family protein [Nitrospirales bacterium]
MKSQIIFGITRFGLIIAIVLLVGSFSYAQNYSGLAGNGFHDGSSDYVVKVYNEDQFKGNWKQLKGALKEQWGEFTDDDLLAIEGRVDRFEGKVQERYGERKEEVREWVDNYLENHPYDPHQEKSTN